MIDWVLKSVVDGLAVATVTAIAVVAVVFLIIGISIGLMVG